MMKRLAVKQACICVLPATFLAAALGLFGMAPLAAVAASPITPERPIPSLSPDAEDLTERLRHSLDERSAILVSLEKQLEACQAELSASFDPGLAPRSAAGLDGLDTARLSRLAQIEVWRSALLAGLDAATPSTEDAFKSFSSRDNLLWCAVLLEAAGEHESALKLVSYARLSEGAVVLVASLISAPAEGQGERFARLEESLRDAPKDTVVATAVETVLRRRIGTPELRARLMATAAELVDSCSGSLRAYLATTTTGERRRLTKGLVGTDGFAISGKLADGTDFSTTSLRGKVVVLAFWAPESPACLVELPRIADLFERFHTEGLEIVSINSVRGGRSLGGFLKRHPEVVWSQLVDPDAARLGLPHPLARQSGVSSFPTYFVIDRDGVLRTTDAASDLDDVVRAALDRP